MAYLLDSNVFIQAKYAYYGMDFCPGFWDWLIASNEDGTVASISLVKQEIQALDDELARWCAQRARGFFVEPSYSAHNAARRIGDWVSDARFKEAAVDKFLGSADHFLIAHALAEWMTVVTHEKPTNSPNKLRIPVVCMQFGVEYITPFEMLRREKVRLVLR